MGWFGDFLSRIGIERREKITVWETPEVSISGLAHYDESLSRPGFARSPGASEVVKSRGLSYFISQGNNKDWVDPQYDHVEIEVIYDVESYFARATRAKLALFRREGYEFIGSKDERVEYVRTRIRQIERASRIPFPILLEQTARDLFVHSNAFWLKVRKTQASGGRERMVGQTRVRPVAGYFPLPPETMVPEVDSSGNVVRWKQEIDGEERIFSVSDIVHFYTNRKVGYALGVPSVVPCIDDIRAIRSIEANIDVLIHKHLFPIILWQVGTEDVPPQTFENGQTELQVVQDAVAAMPTEGSIVVPNRFKVDAIGAENKALRVESYLQHFRERLLAGFDVSSVDVGIGNTSSRSTAQTLSRNLIDIVKKNQCAIQDLAQPVIEELLLESTFAEDSVLASENLVRLKFHEIDKEAKVARENHAVDMFLKNAITFPEMREELGREPLTPEEEEELYWFKFGREEALIGSVDESSGKGVDTGNSSGSVANNNQPQNQHGTRPAPKMNNDFRDSPWVREDSPNPILLWYQTIQSELQARWAEDQASFDFDLASQDIRSTFELAHKDFVPILRQIIRSNYHDPMSIHGLYKEAESRSRKFLERLRNDLVGRLRTSLSAENSPNVIFDTLKYRTVLIYKTEAATMGNLARFKWLRKNNKDAQILANEGACEQCEAQLTVISWNDKLGEDRLPPFHPGCDCEVVVKKEEI